MTGLDGLDPAILGPALVAGLLVLASHVPLGRAVLERGIIFLDLAVAQIAGLGVVLAHGLGWAEHPWGVQLTAVAGALAGALLLHACERRWPAVQEALIGTTFVLAASGGLLLLAGNPHGGEQLKELLSGQILWVDWDHLGAAAGATAALLGVWLAPPQPAGRLRFYTVFAVAVTVSVQLVGVYLVFASLILPALAVRDLPGRTALGIAYACGAVGYGAGLAASALFDLPSGPLVVWTLAAAALTTRLAGGRLHRRIDAAVLQSRDA